MFGYGCNADGVRDWKKRVYSLTWGNWDDEAHRDFTCVGDSGGPTLTSGGVTMVHSGRELDGWFAGTTYGGLVWADYDELQAIVDSWEAE